MYIIPYSYRGLLFQFFYVSHKYYSKGYKPRFHEGLMKRLLKFLIKNRSISAPIFKASHLSSVKITLLLRNVLLTFVHKRYVQKGSQ